MSLRTHTFTVEGSGIFPEHLLASHGATRSDHYHPLLDANGALHGRGKVLDTGALRRVDVVMSTDDDSKLELLPDRAAWEAAGWKVVG